MVMSFVFPALIQAGLASGAYEVVKSQATGRLIGLARDAVTKRFVGHAIGMATSAGASPLLAPMQVVTSLVVGAVQSAQVHQGFQNTYFELGVLKVGQALTGGALAAQSAQIHQGFQKTYSEINVVKSAVFGLQNSVGILQASQAILGVGVVTGVALSAANLWQTMQLRKEVQQLGMEMKEGFLDLERLIGNQGREIRDQIQNVAQDVKFEQHRVILVRAYGKFLEANQLIQTALACDDLTIRNQTLANAESMLSNALADYRNPQLLSDLSAAARLRRLECCWAIEQALVLTFQLRGQYKAVVDRLSQLRSRIAQSANDLLNLATVEETEFLVPELMRIHNADLEIIDSWIDHADWISRLSEDELLEIGEGMTTSQSVEEIEEDDAQVMPAEMILYQSWTQKMPTASIRDAVMFMFDPKLRQPIIEEIQAAATARRYYGIDTENLQLASNLTLANLKQYFLHVSMASGI
ncbi:MAG: hypothetical protein MH825_11060 [Cyanobacteria bacterium]|nr:hypothetical protein [Cyanobacteriota bacterium]